MRPEKIDVDGRRRGHASTVACDLMHHDGCFRDAKSRSAVLLGHSNTEPTRIGHRTMEFMGKLAVLVSREPVFIVKAANDGANPFANGVPFIFRG